MRTFPLVKASCRESYNEPLAVYEKLKRLGMDLPRTLAAAPLALAATAITLGNYIVEHLFARWWMSRYRRLRSTRSGNCAATPIAEAAA